jgi:hypothetical protein
MKRFYLVMLKVEMAGKDQIEDLDNVKAYLDSSLENNSHTVKIEYTAETYEFQATINDTIEKVILDERGLGLRLQQIGDSVSLEGTNFNVLTDENGNISCGPIGKYEFYEDENGTLHCKRDGREWRTFVDDNAVIALFKHTRRLQKSLVKYHEEDVERRLSPSYKGI